MNAQEGNFVLLIFALFPSRADHVLPALSPNWPTLARILSLAYAQTGIRRLKCFPLSILFVILFGRGVIA